MELESVFKEKAKESKIEKVTHFRNTNEVLPTLAKPDTRKEISQIANVSHGTLDKVKVIQAIATPEVKENNKKTFNLFLSKNTNEIKPCRNVRLFFI